MKIFIGADHGGFELKERVKEFISQRFDYVIFDVGASNYDPNDDYPIYAKKVVENVKTEPGSLGILICKTGIGMSIVANRSKGIYAALCSDVTHAQRAKEHNNANILCLDSEFISEEVNFEIVEKFLSTSFTQEERHTRRIQQIDL